MRQRAPTHRLLLLGICLQASAALLFPAAGRAATITPLRYVSGSSSKLEQMIGDHDWADTTRATTSLTVTRANVLGNGLGYSFPSGDSLIFLFGDTIGASQQYVPGWARPPVNEYKWAAHDPIASSRTIHGEDGLLLDFLKKTPDSTLVVLPAYANGDSIDMGGDDIPNSGIALDGQIFLVCSVGTSIVGGVSDHTQDSSVVVQFDPVKKTFLAGRTMSRSGAGGHFLFASPHELPMSFANSPSDSEVLIFGLGQYRHSDIYLSKIRRNKFWSGLTNLGASATRYFTGLVNGQPAWSDTESLAVPVVKDDPLEEIGVGLPQAPWPNDSPTVGMLSVAWSPAIGLWLMTFDGGRQSPPATYLKQTDGIYFSYAAAPWGPWMEPQLIYNATREGGFGRFIHRYDHNSMVGIGPAGPTVGNQAINDPDTTSGGTFGPEIIEPFTQVVGDTLKLYWTMSTWNPYTVVKMRSMFLIMPDVTLGIPAEVPERLRATIRPNPFRARTRVSFSMPRAGAVEVGVFDLAGRRVRELQQGWLSAGAHEFAWDGESDAGAAARTGVYLVRLRASGRDVTTRVVRIE
jgi:hypothetical protein